MNVMTACPDLAGLCDYLLGRMSEAPAAAVEAHLAACTACRKLLPTVQAEDDLVADFRTQAGTPEPATALLDRLASDLRGRLLPPDATTPVDADSMAAATPSPLTGTPEPDPSLAPPQRPDEIGRLGGYRILKELGRGGMGVVYQAEDLKLQRLVALKVMMPRLAADAGARQRFLREAQAMAAVRHDHIVTVFQVDEDRGVPFLAMEFLQGMPLDQWLETGHKPSIAQSLRMGLEIVEGLAAAHERGLIHRDVKPGNVWLDSAHKGRVKILDFGLARAATEDVHLTHTGAVVGTPAYMSPEQARGEKVDGRTDLFSLGCVLYKLCTGVLPFAGDTTTSLLMALALDHPRPVRDLNPDVPAALSELVMRLLAKKPEGRPVSAREVIRAIQAIGGGTNVDASPAPERLATIASSPTTPRAVPPRRRIGALVGLLMGGAIAAAVAVVIVIRDKNGDKVAEVQVPPGGNAQFVDDTKKGAPAVAPKAAVDETWVKKVAALATEQQGAAVAAKLKERNPGFEPWVQATMGRDGVTGLLFSVDRVTDISPAALPWLKKLECLGGGYPGGQSSFSDLSPLKGLSLTYLTCCNSQVSDLSPLKGMPLEFLECTGTKVSDLSPLKGMPLWGLHCNGTPVSDLSPLKDLKLTELWCGRTPVTDLSPLKGMKLKTLDFCETGVTDLSPLRGMPLTGLHFDITPVSDLSPLKGMKLSDLWLQKTKVADLSPLKGMPLTELRFYDTPVSDLSPLKGMPLTTLVFSVTRVTDLSPLKGMPLKELDCDIKPERDAEVLRSIKTLEKINGKPAAEFWKDVDAKKP